MQKFNDDLLVNDGDRVLAAIRYPTILHVLDDQELRESFADHDVPAKSAKRFGRFAGFWAIGLVYLALALATTEYAVNSVLADHGFGDGPTWTVVRSAIPVVSAACGIIGGLLGSVGLLYSKRKEQWLRHRLATERIRQFHFQSFVFRVSEITESLRGSAERTVFVERRAEWFTEFKAKCFDKMDAEFAKVTDEDVESEPWLHRTEIAPPAANVAALNALFSAYRELRIVHQLEYCTYKLRDDHRLFSGAAKRQAQVLGQTGFVFIILIFFIHIVVLLWALLSPTTWETSASLTVNIGVTLIAFAALALRSIEHGLQPERETERYQQYRASIRAILERFDEAPDQAEQLRVMQAMERLSYDEMRNFLCSNVRTKFVM